MQKNTLLIFPFLLLPFLLKAQHTIDPLLSKDIEAQKVWVDSIMNSMTIDEKIGQLFMVQAYSNKDEAHESYITRMIEQYHIGNLIFMKGTPEKQVILTNKYQALPQKVPLLIGFDGEWGLDMRLKNTYRFPWNMTLGAIEDTKLIEQLGQRIGEHCKRIGVHINFAPVVDINTNANNPIIGNRSFGENKENVTLKSLAFTTGMQNAGVLANAKHFPGHGDTETDSHVTLPIINFSKERIDSIELYPFKKQIESKVASIMTAHLSIPSLENNPELPSSLSKHVVTDLLQNSLGFKGLILTDGLNMKGAANYSTSAEINLAAIQAGNDILLIPEDIPESIFHIKTALAENTLTEDRLNYSVRKILKAKYLVGLNDYKPSTVDYLLEDLNTPSDEVLHRALIKKSITVLKNDSFDIPIKNLDQQNIAYVPLGDGSGEHFVDMLKNYAKVDVIKDDHIDNLLRRLEPYNLVIIGFHKPDTNPWKSYNFSNTDLVWLQEIAREKTVILDVFTSPYSLLKVSTFANIENLVVSYQNSKLAQELSAQAIFGAFGINGKLPVSINTNFKTGDGIGISSISRLEYTIPEDAKMSSSKLALIDKYIDTILNKKMAPGGQILVSRYGKVIYNKSFGYQTSNKKQEVRNSDLYDLASLTKILATLPMVMKSEETKKLSIYSNIEDLLPFYKDSDKAKLNIKDILSHYAKLRSWIPFYKKTLDSVTGEKLSTFYSDKKSKKFAIKVARNLYLDADYKDSIRHHIKDTELRERMGYKYSDLGYYMLKDVLESKFNMRLDKLVNSEFYNALGMNRTSYLPLQKFNWKEIVPSEDDDYYRHQLLRGYVHDMGAAMLGGIGGHAGLFANANDVAKIMQMYLQRGYYGGIQFLKPETIDKFNTRYYSKVKNRRGLGFDKPQINPREKPTCACVSDSSFGHSGFTGTYTWADPESGILYVFLSNRVYPTMRNRGLVRQNIRTKIQKVIQDAIIYEDETSFATTHRPHILKD